MLEGRKDDFVELYNFIDQRSRKFSRYMQRRDQYVEEALARLGTLPPETTLEEYKKIGAQELLNSYRREKRRRIPEESLEAMEEQIGGKLSKYQKRLRDGFDMLNDGD